MATGKIEDLGPTIRQTIRDPCGANLEITVPVVDGDMVVWDGNDGRKVKDGGPPGGGGTIASDALTLAWLGL